jgi:DNA-binding HxlR family transcriptional regulator
MRTGSGMNEKAMSRYLGEFPSEIRDAVSELSGRQRWAVFLALLKQEMFFSELKREFDLSSEQLDNILKRLLIGGLVYKEVKLPVEIGDRKKTYYRVSPLGEKLAFSLLDGILPMARSEVGPAIPASETPRKKMHSDQSTTIKEVPLVCEPRAQPTLRIYRGISSTSGRRDTNGISQVRYDYQSGEKSERFRSTLVRSSRDGAIDNLNPDRTIRPRPKKAKLKTIR